MSLIAGSSVVLRRFDVLILRAGGGAGQTSHRLCLYYISCLQIARLASVSQLSFLSCGQWSPVIVWCLYSEYQLLLITQNIHNTQLYPRHIPSRLINQEQTISILSNGRGSFPPVTPACWDYQYNSFNFQSTARENPINYLVRSITKRRWISCWRKMEEIWNVFWVYFCPGPAGLGLILLRSVALWLWHWSHLQHGTTTEPIA